MCLSTNDCQQYIANWIKANPTALPINSSALSIRNSMIARTGKSHISDGTDPSNWKRRAKKTIGNEIIRAFDNDLDIFDITGSVFVLTESDCKITKIEFGDRADFEAKYGFKISW